MNTAFLLVHGIQGSPDQFRFLIDRLPKDVRIRNLLLPGHGKDVKDYRRSGREQWISAVRQAANELRGQCDRLVFVGHSMGCLLGLEIEREHPGILAGMVMLCCPFHIRPTVRYIRNGLLASRKAQVSDDAFICATREANSVSAACPAQYMTCVHPYLYLLKLMCFIRKKATALACPICFIFSERDEIVSPRSVQFAREIVSALSQ